MRIFMIILCTLAGLSVQAQKTDTIHAGDLDLRYLPSGTQRYLVYIKTKENEKKNIWLWERTASRERRDGSEVIVIRQQWTTSDTGFNRREVYSVCDNKTFAPVYHYTSNPRTGREAFNFSSTSITAADTVAGNSKTGFALAITEPSFNWELDLETFPLLPLKEGKTFVINFYHPGSKTGAAWYNYTVSGSEIIPSVNGARIDCFKLFIDYGKNRGNSTWWISKKTHEVLKMEEHFGSVTRYKIKLAASE